MVSPFSVSSISCFLCKPVFSLVACEGNKVVFCYCCFVVVAVVLSTFVVVVGRPTNAVVCVCVCVCERERERERERESVYV